MRIFICPAFAAVLYVAVFSAPQARAAVYRCVLDGGHISYQQFPCDGQSKPLRLRDQRSGWSPLRRGEQALLNSYRKKDEARRRQPSGRPLKQAKDSESCWKRRKQLEAARSKLRRGYKLRERDALHRERDNHADYLRQFCS